MPVADWWLLLHVLQLPLLWLVAPGITDMLLANHETFTTISCMAMLAFAASVTVLDAVAGIATAVLARAAVRWSPAEQVAAAQQFTAVRFNPHAGWLDDDWLAMLADTSWWGPAATHTRCELRLRPASRMPRASGNNCAAIERTRA